MHIITRIWHIVLHFILRFRRIVRFRSGRAEIIYTRRPPGSGRSWAEYNTSTQSFFDDSRQWVILDTALTYFNADTINIDEMVNRLCHGDDVDPDLYEQIITQCTHQHRAVLEQMLPPDHPIIIALWKKWKVTVHDHPIYLRM